MKEYNDTDRAMQAYGNAIDETRTAEENLKIVIEWLKPIADNIGLQPAPERERALT